MTRQASIDAFLTAHGYSPEQARPLAQDASARRYLRLAGEAVLMDAPPPEDVRPFLHMAAHLAGLGLSVPAILAADPANGLVIEEDLGDALFSTLLIPRSHGSGDLRACLEDPERHAAIADGSGAAGHDQGNTFAVQSYPDPETLLAAAIDALAIMQHAAPPDGLPAWSRAEMTQTALGTFLDWWWPAMHRVPAPDRVRSEVQEAMTAMLTPLDGGPRTLVHRDFFAGNLLWLPGRTGPRRAGIIDFQGAAIGHPAYDLVSLLQDARQDIPPAWEAFGIAHFLAARPELDPDQFRLAYTACAAQRHLRVACQWVRLALRDRRPHYLVHGARTWRLLTHALGQPGAAPLAAVLDRHVPAGDRRNPPGPCP